MKRFILKLLAALCLLPVCGAVIVTVGFWAMEGLPLHWALWPLLAVTLATMAGAMAGRSLVPAGVIGLAALLCCAALWYPRHTPVYTLLLSALLFLLVWRAWPRPPFEEWSQALLFGGAGLYILGYLLAWIIGLPRLSSLLLWGLLIYAPVLLPLANHASLLLGASARDGRRPPRRIQMANLKMTAAIAAIAVVAMNIQAIGRAFYAAGDWLLAVIYRAVIWWMSLFSGKEAPMTEAQTPGVMELPAMAEAQEPSFLSALLQKMMDILVTALVVALLLAAAWQIFRLIRRVLRWVFRSMRETARQLGEGVQDKTESILDWNEIRMEARQRLGDMRKRLRRPPRWEDLDDRQRVRRLFAGWLAGHGRPSRTATAREALAAAKADEGAADLYEKARYSSLPIEADDVRAMQRMLRE